MSCFREYGEITVDEVSCYFRCISQHTLRERNLPRGRIYKLGSFVSVLRCKFAVLRRKRARKV